MKFVLKPIVMAALLASVSSFAQAATITLSTPGEIPGSFATATTFALGDTGVLLNPNLSNSSTTATQTFFDDFVFTISAGMNLTTTSLLPINIGSFSESLYNTTTTTYTASGTNPLFALTALTPTTANTWNDLAAGTYTLQYTGTLAKASKVFGLTVPTIGSYGAVVNLAPVPEPETYAMMLAGLGLMGIMVRRRKNKQA